MLSAKVETLEELWSSILCIMFPSISSRLLITILVSLESYSAAYWRLSEPRAISECNLKHELTMQRFQSSESQVEF